MKSTRLIWTLLLLVISTATFAQEEAKVKEEPVAKEKEVEPEVVQRRINVVYDEAGRPVTLHEDTIFNIYVSYGSLSVKHRALIVSDKLNDASEVFDPTSDKVTLEKKGNSMVLTFDHVSLMEITPEDARYANKAIEDLAKEWRNAANASLQHTLSRRDTLIQYAISVAIILAALLLIHYVLRYAFRKLNIYIRRKKSKWIKGIRIKDFEIMDANDEMELILKITFGVRILLLLIIANIVFPLIFSLFPATEFIANEIFQIVLNPFKNFANALIGFIPNLITIIVIVYIVKTLLKYLKIAALRIESGRLKIAGFYPDWSKTTYEMIRILIIALSFVMVFPYLPGAQSNVFKGVSVFIGVIFSLGSTSIVGNLVAGLVLTYMRPFKIGDRISIGEVEGEIVEKTAFVIRIKTPKNEFITIPNSNVQAAHIINYNQSFDVGGVILFTDITIGYDVPWRKVHELLLQAADQTPDLEKDPKPFVLQKGLEDFSVAYQINAFTKRPLYKDLISSLLHQNIQDIFNEAGVEIMSPNYIASRDGNKNTIPDNGSGPKEG